MALLLVLTQIHENNAISGRPIIATSAYVCCMAMPRIHEIFTQMHETSSKKLCKNASLSGVSGARTRGFPGVSEGFRGFPTSQRPYEPLKSSVKTWENAYGASWSHGVSSGRADPFYNTKKHIQAPGNLGRRLAPGGTPKVSRILPTRGSLY